MTPTTEQKGNVSEALVERLEWQGKIASLKGRMAQREETRDYSMAYLQALDDLLEWNRAREAKQAEIQQKVDKASDKVGG